MNLALKTIKERKFKNPITSVFLLSDGLDNDALENIKKLLRI